MKPTENKIFGEESARINRLDGGCAKFGTKNGFLCLELTGEDGVRIYDRVFLHRAFPYELPEQYISVQGEENKEIGIIFDISDLDDSSAELVRRELDRKYYAPIIKEIKSVKERYGFSYWKVTDISDRELSFTVKDTFKSIKRLGDDTITVVDVDGNRFTIESVSALSQKSYRKIELYL